MGRGAFAGCTSLTSITLPDSLTSIGDYAFEGCSPNLQVFWCDQSFNPIPQQIYHLQAALKTGWLQLRGSEWRECSKRKRKRDDDDDEAGSAKKRSFTDTFTRERPDYSNIVPAYTQIVPDWAGPGSVVRVQVPEYGRPADLTVPDGVGPGDMFYWNIVPDWAGPGSVVRMQIIPDGRLFDVQVPDGIGPGDIIQFEV
jgi:hypothetical protein